MGWMDGHRQTTKTVNHACTTFTTWTTEVSQGKPNQLNLRPCQTVSGGMGSLLLVNAD